MIDSSNEVNKKCPPTIFKNCVGRPKPVCQPHRDVMDADEAKISIPDFLAMVYTLGRSITYWPGCSVLNKPPWNVSMNTLRSTNES